MAEYDLLIKNGTVVDGLRMPAYRGDIGIRGGSAAGPSGTPMPRYPAGMG